MKRRGRKNMHAPAQGQTGRPCLYTDTAAVCLFSLLFAGFFFLPSSPHRIVMYASVLLSCAAFFRAGGAAWVRQALTGLGRRPLVLAVLALVAFNALSLLWSVDEGFSRYIKYGKQMFFIPLFMLGYGLILMRRPRSYGYFIRAFLIAAALMSAAALVNHFLILDMPLRKRVEGFGRAENSVMLGFLNGVAILLLLFPDRETGAFFKRRHLRWILLVPIAVCFVLTMSRGPFVAVGAGSVVMLLVRGQYRQVAALAACAGLALVLVLSSETVGGSLLRRATSGRFDVWRQAMELIAAKPFLGHGVATNHNYTFDDSGIVKRATHAHSIYLSTLVQTGAAGLFLFLATYAAAFWAALKSVRDSGVHSPLIFLVAGALLGLTDFGGFYTSFGVPWLIFWMPVAYLAAQEAGRA